VTDRVTKVGLSSNVPLGNHKVNVHRYRCNVETRLGNTKDRIGSTEDIDEVGGHVEVREIRTLTDLHCTHR